MKIEKSTQALAAIGTLGLCLSPLVLTACMETTASDNVKTRAIYQSYNVAYDEESSAVSANASFNVGGPFGTSLELKSPSRVDFNSHEMRKTRFLDTSYTGRWASQALEPSYSWTWVDPDGKSYVNSTAVTAVHIDQAPDTFSRSGVYSITVSGPSFSSQDSFEVEMSQTLPGGAPSTILSVNPSGNHTLLINVEGNESARLSLKLGSAKLSLKRIRTSKLQQATEEGGSIRSTYIAKRLTVQITE